MAIYKNVKGKQTKISNKEIKQTIMQAHGFRTTEQYEKYYDITRNRLRALEAYEGRKSKQSVQEILYREAKAKLKYGDKYKQSVESVRLHTFTSISSGKSLQKSLQNKEWQQKQASRYTMQTYEQFSGLIEKNAKAKEIYESIQNPVKREQALVAFASKMHAERDLRGRTTGESSIPQRGEIVGSDTYDNFNYAQYLD